MRAALPLLMLSLAACPGLNNGGSECAVDSDCGGDICARDHACHPASEVRGVLTQWTIRGQPANDISCAGAQSLYIRFESTSDDSLGFAPVPCNLGQFNIDKLPTRFGRVELGVDEGDVRHSAVTRAIDSEGRAQIDLSP
jgi:hypothetical protein